MRLSFTQTIFAILLAVSFTGCRIYEDRSHCKPLTTNNVILNFRYTNGGATDVFPENVNKVDLMVYDESGLFIVKETVTRKDLEKFQGVKLELPEGTYRIVCWGNVEKYKHCEYEENFSQANIRHINAEQGSAENGDSLFYAPKISEVGKCKPFMITVPRYGTVEETIEFSAVHKTIEVYIQGFTETRAIGLPLVEISPISIGYDYEMNSASATMKYRGETEKITVQNNNYALARFHAPLFDNDNSITIDICSPTGGESIHTINLKEFLETNNIILNPIGHDLIQIIVKFVDMEAEVTLPGWEGEDTEGEV